MKKNKIIDVKYISEIKIKLKIEENDIDSNIYFLDNTNRDDFYENGKRVKHVHDNLPELNTSTTKLFINDHEEIFSKFFIPEITGIYNIKLTFNKKITNCKYMFYDCKKIIDIDLSLFDSKNVKYMRSMFEGCKNLTNINLSSFNTQKARDMSYMFFCCGNLKKIDLSSFNTKNVYNMAYMFDGCNSLTNIDLSFFNTINVINMVMMFAWCTNLVNIDLSFFNTKKLKKFTQMFYRCKKLNMKISRKSYLKIKQKEIIDSHFSIIEI